MASDKLADRNPKSGFKPNLLGIFVVFVIVAVAGSVVVYSLSDWTAPEKARQMRNPFPPTPKAIGLGMSTYQDRCQNCHGEDGNGKGERAEKLSVAPSNFTDAHAMSQMTDGELFWKISEGHRPMPAFKSKLSEEERWQLVDYIRTFSQPLLDSPAESSKPLPDKDAAPK
jgi:mono/diheme cytochrome c family protein